ncbi:F-box protein At3g07870-like [Papaver somniferum]|uniref:F-box protein At3g07870-like n=1 Tax=Papaver somniferum TaxID=3469 RepID=UPI000E700240|nr:F-box protein At3g07870-like [Papaver somniferum]
MGKLDDLLLEIISDILSRLLAESVLECKLVSKSWKDLVSHRSFSQLHLNRLNIDDSGKLGFIFTTNTMHYTMYDEISGTCIRTARDNFRTPAIISGYYAVAFCNGLVCFDAAYGDDWKYFQPSFILNPITREYVMLPRIEIKVQVMCGFGCIPSTNVYKVIRMYELADKHVQVEVYTFGSGNGWRDVGQIDYPFGRNRLPGVFVDGAVYWFLPGQSSIAAFNLADERFSQVPSPPFLFYYYSLHLGVLGDFLCATYPIYGLSSCSFDVWVLKKNNENHGMSWIKQFNLVGYEPFTFTKSGGVICCGAGRTNLYR